MLIIYYGLCFVEQNIRTLFILIKDLFGYTFGKIIVYFHSNDTQYVENHTITTDLKIVRHANMHFLLCSLIEIILFTIF